MHRELVDAWLDLVLGSSCVACGHPGRVLCGPCRRDVGGQVRTYWPTIHPPWLAPPYAVGDYEDPLRAMVLAHKERRVLGLTAPLGRLLARAAEAALTEADVPVDDPVVLVPVPSRTAAVRQRGHDPTRAMTVAAARVLKQRRPLTMTAPLLRLRQGVADQAGLDTAGRAANLAGSMAASSGVVRRLAQARPQAHVIVCDDVITTGATLAEAQRALAAVGIAVLASTTVAATRRRRPPPRF